ncbi:histidinol-phosphate transaminase [Sporosarcina ureilytica]|uniref:Histidinol-phosphate aminotransferase n=1 Tax=Sporosarcina ureilytica TaxID=298596 RepID=A0A1D8JH66_9BACL|nr:histidinol-phosphate transaminase [Sporosarcina ureilytica]AOV08062.1 histidinol-phosphate transaminase [Sporosarcina ureilytica]
MRWRRVLKEMAPYTPGKSIEEVKAMYGLEDIVKLASNENPYGASPVASERLAPQAVDLEIYPDGYAGKLRTKIASELKINENELLFGSGSDEIIVIIARALLGEGTNTIVATPTFPQYKHHALIEGAEVKEIPLINGEHNLDGFLEAIDNDTSVIWLCSPNNPTGNLIEADKLTAFLAQVPERVLVVLDEAYYEYIVDENYIDTVELIQKHKNVLILRTFSKAYGLAALRVGYAIGDQSLITPLNTTRSPFNVTSLSLAVAEKAFTDKAFIEKCRTLNRAQMERFYAYAEQHGLHVFDSQANFVLLQVPGSATEATEELLKKGYIVRSGDALGTPGYIRVTVGTAEQNDGFFKAFDTLLEGAGRLK